MKPYQYNSIYYGLHFRTLEVRFNLHPLFKLDPTEAEIYLLSRFNRSKVFK